MIRLLLHEDITVYHYYISGVVKQSKSEGANFDNET